VSQGKSQSDALNRGTLGAEKSPGKAVAVREISIGRAPGNPDGSKGLLGVRGGRTEREDRPRNRRECLIIAQFFCRLPGLAFHPVAARALNQQRLHIFQR